MDRRRMLLAGLAHGGLLVAGPSAAQEAKRTAPALRFGTTPVFLDDQAGFLARWAGYLSHAMGRPVQFVQRRAYRDIVDMLRTGALDAAWICGYPWVVNRAFLQGVSIPLYRGEPWYQSYLIVPRSDLRTERFAQLAGRVYAFSDPDSNSGYLVPRAAIAATGADPDRHFRRTFFTWGHRNVVSCVAEGLSHGGSVDGYVWDTLQQLRPELTSRTRIAWRSERHGFPPVVARSGLAPDAVGQLKQALAGMRESEGGRRLLAELNLSAFGRFEPAAFASIARLTRPGRAG